MAYHLLKIFCVSFILMSCSKDQPKAIQEIELSEMNQLIAPAPLKNHTSIDKKKNIRFNYTSLKKGALLHPLLLQIKTYPNSNSKYSKIYASKAVHFEKVGDKLILTEVKNKKLITVFKILEEKEGKIIFDFNSGMNKVLELKNISESEKKGSSTLLHINKSYIKESYVKNKFFFASMHINTLDQKAIRDIKIDFIFSSYSRNRRFISQNIQTKNDSIIDYISVGDKIAKIDKLKDFVFTISKNTPKDYIQSIKDGIEYWNKSKVGLKLRVRIQVNNSEINDPSINMISWLDSSLINYPEATPNILFDSGEIIQGNIYLPEHTLEKMVGVKENLSRNIVLNQKNTIRPKNFKNHKIDLDPNDIISKNIFLEGKINSVISKNLKQDYLRYLVAHEVGHILGLRHNFAGSKSNNLPSNKKVYNQIIKGYVLTGQTPTSFTTTSSVMDYLNLIDGAFTGNKIKMISRYNKEILKDDTNLLLDLYTNTKDIIFQNYCSDKDLKFIDCKKFDSFSSIKKELEFNYNLSQNNIITHLLKNSSIPKKIASQNIKNYYNNLFLLLTSKSQFKRIRNLFPNQLDYKSNQEYQDLNDKEKKLEINQFESIEEILFNHFIKDDSGLTNQSLAILERLEKIASSFGTKIDLEKAKISLKNYEDESLNIYLNTLLSNIKNDSSFFIPYSEKTLESFMRLSQQVLLKSEKLNSKKIILKIFDKDIFNEKEDNLDYYNDLKNYLLKKLKEQNNEISK